MSAPADTQPYLQVWCWANRPAWVDDAVRTFEERHDTRIIDPAYIVACDGDAADGAQREFCATCDAAAVVTQVLDTGSPAYVMLRSEGLVPHLIVIIVTDS